MDRGEGEGVVVMLGVVRGDCRGNAPVQVKVVLVRVEWGEGGEWE